MWYSQGVQCRGTWSTVATFGAGAAFAGQREVARTARLEAGFALADLMGLVTTAGRVLLLGAS